MSDRAVSRRSALLDFLSCDETEVRSALCDLLASHPDTLGDDGNSPDRVLDPHRLPETHSAASVPVEMAEDDDRTGRDRRLIERVRLLDDAPLGVTLCGPAYRDTPIRYANRTFRDLTGYSLAALRGRNPRLLQGPKTNDSAVADLREAVSIWSR